MKSLASPEFWELYRPLPANVKRDARAAYQLFQDNPSHPGLRLEQVNTKWGWLYSVRVNARYRAMAIKREDHWLWVWIGTHTEYDHLRRCAAPSRQPALQHISSCDEQMQTLRRQARYTATLALLRMRGYHKNRQ